MTGPSRRAMTPQEGLVHNPGLLKLFDEILVNACDNMVRTHHARAAALRAGGGGAALLSGLMTQLRVDICRGDAATRTPPVKSWAKA